jgi:hypothetical protein
MKITEVYGQTRPKEILKRIVDLLNNISDLSVTEGDLEVYWDGISFAVRIKSEEIDLLFSDNDISEDSMEEAEFTSWPPRSSTREVIKITETQNNNESPKK